MQKDNQEIVDHLFREEHGKMVSSLVRIYGIRNLEPIEDAVQETFYAAILSWRNNGMPDNPSGWLRRVARNKLIDYFRKNGRVDALDLESFSGAKVAAIHEVFSDHEIGDNQLRLLFAICHPALSIQDQVIFALKTFSGFSRREIASSLLKNEESVKKSLSRAKSRILEEDIRFEIPHGNQLAERLQNVHLTLYLLFNEGFHSAHKSLIIRKDLIAEAMRLCALLKEKFNHFDTNALMAMMCFHGARIEAKLDEQNELVQLEYQDRNKWNYPLIFKGHEYMDYAVKAEIFSRYHWEAAIAGAYIMAPTFEEIDWSKIKLYYDHLITLVPSAINQLNRIVVLSQQGKMDEAFDSFKVLNEKDFGEREYLYYAVGAELYFRNKEVENGSQFLNLALEKVENEIERKLVLKRIDEIKKGS